MSDEGKHRLEAPKPATPQAAQKQAQPAAPSGVAKRQGHRKARHYLPRARVRVARC
ncbi:hypothetical protein FHS44_004973 [Streptosporangium saharense]|uniref:Uncharacterized protein n=1 Tax=Streptosporangium saharense TaxID=1706840 RepID=A0A7W7QQI8_9ACTN|nr:hypothetical protein [Streptosporangium saharense]